jgi:two-component system LytT family response regulator
MKIKALIVDDERLARNELKRLLEDHKQIEVIAEASNGPEAIELIGSKKPDLVFLDIQMPGMTGFEVLEQVSVVSNVIFVTAYDEYAIKAFEVNALDYVLKPVDPDRLKKAIDALPKETASDNQGPLNRRSQIFIKDGEKCFFVKLENVRMFESEGNYVRLYFENSKPMVLKSLNNLEKRLDEKEFFRVSRKYILNLEWIEKVENWFNGGLRATLKTGEKIEISRRQASRFKDMMAL